MRSARRAGERDGAARGGRRRLSRSLEGINPRAGAAPLGGDPGESRQCARKARRAGGRDGAAQGGCRRLSRSLAGIYPRARAAPMGQDPEQSRHCPFCLGERESGTARLDEAVNAFREALQELTRARAPLLWARTKMYVGNAFPKRSETGSPGTARLTEAIAAFREASQEFTRERVPLDWATTQNNLGNALACARRAGERDGAAGGGRRRLSRSLAGKDPRARAARLGRDPVQSRLGL